MKHARGIIVLVIIAAVACAIAIVPVIVANTDGNPGNNVQTFDDWVDTFTGPDVVDDQLAQQLPDQQDTFCWESGLYPMLPYTFMSLVDNGHSLYLPWSDDSGSGYVQLMGIRNATELAQTIGLEQESDMYCYNGTAHVYWFKAMGSGRPLMLNDHPLRPGFFYIVGHAGTWYMNSIAMDYTLSELVTWLDTTGAVIT